MNTEKYSLDQLSKFLKHFETTSYWNAMKQTVEDSPWHREKNVAIHTRMTISSASQWFPKPARTEVPSEREQILHSITLEPLASKIERLKTASPNPKVTFEYSNDDQRHIVLVTLALLFHDTGKPIAEVVKESETRGIYRSYANHEQASARFFEEFVVDNWSWFDGWIEPWDVYFVTWMIEHHLPYGLKDKNKIKALASVLDRFGPINEQIFYNVLLGDSHGRDSDNWSENTAKVIDWINEMTTAVDEVNTEDPPILGWPDQRTMTMLVAPPGAGKSTVRLGSDPSNVFCLDDLRIEFYKANNPGVLPMTDKEEYRCAFGYATAREKEFNQFTEERLMNLFKGNFDIIIDNTNLSVKTRRKYLALAKQRKMKCVAYYIPTSLPLLFERNATRPDKELPTEALDRMINSVAIPSEGAFSEFDLVYYLPHNFGWNQ